MKKEDSFKLPKGYFDNKKQELKNIATTVATAESVPGRVIRLKPYIYGGLATASMLVLAFFVWPTHNSPGPTVKEEIVLEEVMILNYLNENSTATHFNYFLVEEEIFYQQELQLDDDEVMDYLETQPLEFYNL